MVRRATAHSGRSHARGFLPSVLVTGRGLRLPAFFGGRVMAEWGKCETRGCNRRIRSDNTKGLCSVCAAHVSRAIRDERKRDYWLDVGAPRIRDEAREILRVEGVKL